jgi:ribose transport system permease protein
MLGLRTGRLIVGAFILCGAIAAFTGVITASQLQSGQPAIGPDYLLPAYACAFLGATTIRLGQFNVLGTVVAAYLLGSGVAGLQQLGLASYVQDFFNGGALLIAVAASGYMSRRRAAAPPDPHQAGSSVTHSGSTPDPLDAESKALIEG